MKIRFTLFFIVAFFYISLATVFAQTTYYVSPTGGNTPPYSSWADAATNIQDAVDLAIAGDLVLVDDGTYLLSTNISITKGITVRSVNGYSASIIDGNNATRCFYINHADAVVDGFTIQNGYNPSSFGGNVDIASGGTVQNCFITGGQARDGGGVAIDNSGLVVNCILTNNLADNNSGSGYGGGIRLLNGGTARNCLVYENTSVGLGGGINIWSAGTIENCTVVNNTGPNGAGIRCRGTAVMRNTISYFNNGTNVVTAETTGKTYTNNCTTPALPLGTGNITDDPLFENYGSNDFHLTSSSTLINAGLNDSWMTGAFDIDGNDRILDGTVDIGAYEFVSLVQLVSDDFFNDTSPKSFWRFFDPAGDVTLNMSGTNAEFQIPSGSDHDLWVGAGNRAPRLLQAVSNIDFAVEVKFESVPSVQYQLQGIIVQESDTKFLRFGTYSNGSSRFVFKVFIDGSSSYASVNTNIGSAVAAFLRVERTGDDWTYSYSTDGVTYTPVTSFTQVINVTEVGFYGGNGGSNPSYIASADYFWNLTDTGFEDTDAQTPTPPTIEVWYGDTQTFGNLGNPQQWINVMGNVSDANGVASLEYTLNGGSSNLLNIGPDGKRLVNDGDFNIEIDKTDLLNGANTIEITAEDALGATATETVTINYSSGNVWPLPYTADWSSISNIEDVNQVANIVDGLWELTPQGIHTVQTGYDRLIAVGDETWSSSMEVEVPITIHSASGGSGIGFALGWRGHTGSASPRLEWPLEAIGWVRSPGSGSYLEILTYPGTTQGTQGVTVDLGTTYILKIRSEDAGSGNSFFQVKLWEEGTTEPASYMLDATLPSRSGSVLMITHRADVTWGNMSITPIAANQAPQFTSTPVTNAQVGDPYTYNVTTSDANTGDVLTITANTIPGWLSLVDNGDGTAVLSGTPQSGDIGLNNVELQVEDQLGASSTQSFAINVQPSGDAVLQSDHFCTDGALESFWQVYDPYTESGMPSGGISTIDVDNSNLVIDVPGGFDHNHWSGSANLAPRVLQYTQDIDFEVEAKFISVPSQRYQLQGITAQQDNDTFLRFEIFHDGSNVKIFAAFIDGASATSIINSTLASVPAYLRINRTGSNWTFDYSFDGTNWNTATTFSNGITVTQVGIHAGNTGTTPPPFTALVDYFHVSGDPLTSCKLLTLNTPNGGQTWNVGDTETITWTSLNVNNIKIELSTNNGGGWIELESSYNASLGTYSLTVPNSPSNQCLVRITDVDDNSLFDVSDNTFSIELIITHPTIVIGSANTYAGTTVTLPVELITVPGFGMDQILQAKIHYDPAKLSFLFGSSGSGSLFSSNGWTGVYYVIYPGTVEIFASGYNPITTSGNLFNLTFQIIAGTAGTADVTGLTAEWTVDLYNHPFVIQNGQVIYSNPPAISSERGDATLNFIVDIYDALAVVYHIVGLAPLGGQAFINADVDFDNDVDINDYISIVLYVYLHDWNYPFTPVPASAAVSFEDNQSANHELIELPVLVNNAERIQSVQLDIDFDTEKFEFHSFKSNSQSNTFADAFESQPGKVNMTVVSNKALESDASLGSIVLKKKDSNLFDESEIRTKYNLNMEGFKDGPTLFVGANGVTDINDDIVVNDFELFQNYPNPFNPTTQIRFAIPNASHVSLKIYDMLGKEIKELMHGELASGIYEVNWDGTNNLGTKVSSGTYIYRITADSYTKAKTMILIK